MAKTLHSQCRGPRFDPWSGNYRSLMLLLKILCSTMKIEDLRCASKTQGSQINKYILKKKKKVLPLVSLPCSGLTERWASVTNLPRVSGSEILPAPASAQPLDLMNFLPVEQDRPLHSSCQLSMGHKEG